MDDSPDLKTLMHYFIDAGHNSPPGDTGAVGLAVEDKLTVELADRIVALLTRQGHQVSRSLPTRAADLTTSLKARVAIANKAKADRYISLHFNKFLPAGKTTDRAMGAEIYVASAAGRQMALPVMDEISKLGFAVHDAPGASGVKNEDYYVLVHSDMPAMLIESFFLDSTADFAIFRRLGMDLLARAIVTGLNA